MTIFCGLIINSNELAKWKIKKITKNTLMRFCLLKPGQNSRPGAYLLTTFLSWQQFFFYFSQIFLFICKWGFVYMRVYIKFTILIVFMANRFKHVIINSLIVLCDLNCNLFKYAFAENNIWPANVWAIFMSWIKSVMQQVKATLVLNGFMSKYF